MPIKFAIPLPKKTPPKAPATKPHAFVTFKGQGPKSTSVVLAHDEANALAELTDMQPAIAAAKDLLRKASALEAVLKSAGQNRDPEEELMLEGADGARAVLTPGSSKRIITDMKAVHAMLGDELFYAHASIPLEVLDQHISKHYQETTGMVASSRSNSRQVKIQKREA